MYLSVLVLVGSTVCGTTRITDPNLEAVNFAHVIERRRLNGSVIKEIEVDSEVSCKFECVKEEKCFSYNVGSTNSTKSNAKRFKCQLSDSDRFAGFANFSEDKDFKYGGLQVITKKSPAPWCRLHLQFHSYLQLWTLILLLLYILNWTKHQVRVMRIQNK